MKKTIEVRKETGRTITYEYAETGFIGACRMLWHFWKHNGTHLDDYEEFRIRVIERKKK